MSLIYAITENQTVLLGVENTHKVLELVAPNSVALTILLTQYSDELIENGRVNYENVVTIQKWSHLVQDYMAQAEFSDLAAAAKHLSSKVLTRLTAVVSLNGTEVMVKFSDLETYLDLGWQFKSADSSCELIYHAVYCLGISRDISALNLLGRLTIEKFIEVQSTLLEHE